jgi:hypothetical protein
VLVAAATKAAADAWATVGADVQEVPVPVPPGKLPAQDGDDDVAALLRYLGRDPEWTA